MAEWLVLKLHLEEKLEGGQRLEQGASLGLFRPSTVEARDRSAGPPSALQKPVDKAASFIARGPSEVGFHFLFLLNPYQC